MSIEYGCSVRLLNGFKVAINNVQLTHQWTGDPGQNKTAIFDVIDGASLSNPISIKSGSDGYDYWTVTFSCGEYIYEVDQKRCSLNTLDENALLVFKIQWKGDDEAPVLLLTMNSDPCKETFKKKKVA